MAAKEKKEALQTEIARERLRELDYLLKSPRRTEWVRSILLRERRDLREQIAWWEQEEPCSGSGYAHAAHGNCPGYSTDRT